ncbi:FtsX-like permease family protein [Actinoallomurus rhizosphaericola]|uniref:FtsX-like permease family protein n=1 Tax=Actinoallomurus rhizosphaericola TaxID=2952536 RepID=UPI002093FF4B|nr:FtsX-like permease family protein [Actinoallomurus rhizosphaericola]MCO5995871.1 ABC transporter permease [Actinoallomurus rhizosphaericola]
MFRLALATLRQRKGSAVGGFLALFCAAMIVCACGVLLETGIHGSIPAERYAGAPVVVSADQQIHWTKVKEKNKKGKHKVKRKTKSKALSERAWLSTSVGDRIAALPGAKVVADLTFPANVVEHDGSVLSGVDGRPSWGHGWSSAALTPYRLRSGSAPQQDGDVVLDEKLADRAGLKVGDQTVVQSTSSPKTYRVVGIARPDVDVKQQSAMFFDEAEARRLAGHPGLVAGYGVFGVSGAKVKDAVAGTGAVVATGDGRGQVEFIDAAKARVKLTSMGGAIGGTSLIVAVLVVVGTFALSIQQRYRELALLRAVGATPRQVRRMISREALVLGLTAGVPGALLGIPLASTIRAKFVSLGAIPDALRLFRGPLPVLAALVATVGAAWVAARVTGRRTARIKPAEALAEAAVERRTVGFGRVVAALVFTAVAVIITVVLSFLHTEPAAMPVTYLSILLWMIAVALWGPFITRGAVVVLGGLLRAFPVGGFLAARNSQANSRRVASVITPLALLIGMLTTILFVPVTMNDGARAQTKDGVKADYLVGSSGPGVPAAAAQELRAVPGVKAVTEVLQTIIWVGKDKRSAQGLTSAGVTQMVDPDVTSGSLDRLAPGTIAMSELAAQGRHIGDAVQVTLGDGVKTQLHLVAIYSRGLGFGDTLLAHDDIVGHVDDPLAKTVMINGSVSVRDLRSHLKGFPGLQVLDRSGYDKVQAAREQTNAEVNLVFMGLIIAFAAIAVVNTLAMATGDRTREFALMRLVGTTRPQVFGVLRWELSLIIVVAAVLGTGAAWLTLTGFNAGMVGSGTPSVVLGTYAEILAGAIVLGLVASLVPARMMLRRNPAEDINARR